MELRQGPLRVPLRPQRRPADHARWSATRRPASTGRRRGPRRSRVAARGLAAAAGSVGVLTGGRLTGEDAYAYSKFARVALGTNDIDFRARAHSAEEADFLAAHVVGRALDVTYADLEKASVVRARRLRARGRVADRVPAAAQGRPQAPAPRSSRSRRSPRAGCRRCDGTLIRTAPGDEAAALEALAHDGEVALDARRRDPGRRAARHRPRRAVRGARPWPAPPAPGWPGSRAGPASAVRSRPAACRTCCPAAVRSPTPPPASTSAPSGARTVPHETGP